MSKVLIGVPTKASTEHTDFYDYYNLIERIPDTLHMFARGQSPAKNRNLIIQAALDNECSHVLFIDDDVIPPPDILKKLLAHDKDVVSGLYPMRSFPHFPIAFDKVYENGFNRHLHLKDEIEGLIPITNCGLGCVLIKIEVFKKLPKPWITLGELEADGWCDDIAFFNKVLRAGFEMYCDTNVIVDHMMRINVGFRKVNGKWLVQYDCRGEGNLQFPVTYPTSDIDLAKRIDGWMSDKELDFLGVMAKQHKRIVEVGCYKGRSTRALADNIVENGLIIAVDLWDVQNYSDNGTPLYKTNEDTLSEFMHNLRDHITAGRIDIIKSSFTQLDLRDFHVDFVFLDADHRYEYIKNDIEHAIAMKPKVLAGHDYDPKVWPGVVQAVDSIFYDRKVNVVDTIWWVELGSI